MKTLKIATYNVNGIRSRLPQLLQWLQREAPDIVGLQELKSVDAGFPLAELHAAGYGAVWMGQSGWNGVALLAKGCDPVESRRGLPGDPRDTQSRYIEAMAHGVLVGCLYLPNGNPRPGPKFDYKLDWFARLQRHAQQLVALPHPVALIGDFNVVPTDADIYNPASWRRDALLQPESRQAYAELLAQGWTDSLRQVHGERRVYTFWDYFRQHWQRDAGLRIDHLLLNPPLAARLRDAGVDRWVRDLPHASDHAPTWVTLGPAPARGKSLVKPGRSVEGAGSKTTRGAAKKSARTSASGATSPAAKAAARSNGKTTARTAAKSTKPTPATKTTSAKTTKAKTTKAQTPKARKPRAATAGPPTPARGGKRRKPPLLPPGEGGA
ncbi:exodeoxyribonuclease III [Xanthomonas sp. A2111]|uniref:Exodeoxyribonuclease III n=1 Tax=Xanthomonas hawaiiensis TaxID=3003247 RepID=A0ABU2I6E0_9XANT|nr:MULTISPECIES: exodeoxyribonuclease III [unclassified Xanthomonas]MBO9829537.1 exodeoxyribonuclease III [Xanthomonas sp. A2111]MBO9875356.1 exodeoxyribonuclease III [Xanthomonas sp. D-93]MDS9993700.1 exodeoxyribonuclease III [Xanthomonas sp. A2111]WNH45439.1 exodeoxyribonuclease III [Xanthomonas sp. A6251]